MAKSWAERMRRAYGRTPPNALINASIDPGRLLGWACVSMVRGYHHKMVEVVSSGITPKAKTWTFVSEVPTIDGLVSFLKNEAPVALAAIQGYGHGAVQPADPELVGLPSDEFLFAFCVGRPGAIEHRSIVRVPLSPGRLATGPDVSEFKSYQLRSQRDEARLGPKGRALSDRAAVRVMNGQCNRCNAAATSRCARCGTVYYCSPGCQRSDWASHKVQCVLINSIVASEPAADALARQGINDTQRNAASRSG